MCHQTVCLVAEALEAAGIPCVIAGSMRAPLAKMPRVLLTRYDRGKNFGEPGDAREHLAIAQAALALFTASEPVIRDHGSLA